MKKSSFRNQLRRAEYYGYIMQYSGTCPFCGSRSVFLVNRFDAKACFSCDRWLEEACSDPECPYCANRPVTPAGTFFQMKEEIQRYIQRIRKDRLREQYQHQHDGESRHQKRKLFYQELKNKGG